MLFFFQFFNSPVALKNNKKISPPQEKVEMTPMAEYWLVRKAQKDYTTYCSRPTFEIFLVGRYSLLVSSLERLWPKQGERNLMLMTSDAKTLSRASPLMDINVNCLSKWNSCIACDKILLIWIDQPRLDSKVTPKSTTWLTRCILFNSGINCILKRLFLSARK